MGVGDVFGWVVYAKKYITGQYTGTLLMDDHKWTHIWKVDFKRGVYCRVR
jgi:hypothetical protein